MMKLARVAIAVLLACAACKDEAAVTAITIGQVIDRTGSIATPSWSDAIRLAVGTANEALKQAGQSQLRFTLVDANSGNTPDMARAGALQVVQKQGAKAVITDSSQDDIAINMLAYDDDPSHALAVPVVCMACTSLAIDNPADTDADPINQPALRNG